MSIQSLIEQKITDQLRPEHLEVINESGQHNVPAGSESHFKLIIVTDAFIDQNLLSRHRTVNGILADELSNHIHALALRTLTPEEWQAIDGNTSATPNCMGGEK